MSLLLLFPMGPFCVPYPPMGTPPSIPTLDPPPIIRPPPVFAPEPIGFGTGALECTPLTEGGIGDDDAQSDSLNEPDPVGSSIPNIEARAELPVLCSFLCSPKGLSIS